MLIHADADAFFASVEARDDPSLRGVPFVVAGPVVACASYAARALGVRSGIPTGHALRIARDLRVVTPRFAAYERASSELFALFAEVTAFVEPGSMEEAFLDVEAVGRDAVETATALRARAREQLGLPVSMGVGTTKLMAKIASRRAKPDGMVVIGRGSDRAVRLGLRFEDVWGLGPGTVAALQRQGWWTVADVVPLEIGDLTPVVGKMQARRLTAIAAGLDDARIRAPGERRSAGASRTIAPTRSRSVVEGTFADLLRNAWARLPPAVEITRVEVALRFEDGYVVGETRDVRPALTGADSVGAVAGGLLGGTSYEDDGRGVSFLSVGLVCRPARTNPDQLGLF